MLQIAVNDTHGTYIVADARHSRHERAVTPYKQVNPYSSLRSLIQLLHHVALRDMVYLYLQPSLLASFRILYLRVDKLQKFCLHGVRRYEKFAESWL